MLVPPSFSTLFILLSFIPSAHSVGLSYYELAADSVFNPDFVPLISRVKRQTATAVGIAKDDLLDMSESTFPPEYDVEDDNKEEKTQEGSVTTSEHTYYNMTAINHNQTVFDSTYVDVSKWIQEGGAEGHTNHDHLNEAYRKAAGVRLKFEFPFYGHRLNNLTIATGGFLYVGDQTHSWLAATQYIAPLMANFDTMADNSSIQYADDGKRMVVEWRDVTLRDNREAGSFTFQVHLWRNGNITFVYKQVPLPVANISDAQHPCKLGISDAYLFNHKVSSLSQAVPQNKRVIHEYHRIAINPDQIRSNTVVMLKALPTCLEATSCERCIAMQLKAFKCSWCNPKDSGKGPWKEGGGGMAEETTGENGGRQTEKPFCSDQLGLNRRRQEWIEGNCQMHEENQYCKADEQVTNSSSSSTSTLDISHPDASPSAAVSSSVVTPDGVALPASTTAAATTTASGVTTKVSPNTKAKRIAEEGSGGGLAFVTMFMLLGISVSVWLLYAYFNPHTRSGQLLIKYRPSKWQLPSSHVRYSASVHM